MKRIGALLLAGFIILSLAVPTRAAPLPSASPVERGIAPGWRAEHPAVLRTFADMGPRSLAIDSANHLYLAYGGDHLYYTHNEGSGWAAPEVVDPDWGVGRGVSLAVDSARKVHISYVDTAQGGLRYATNKSGSWVVTTLFTGSDLSSHTALALDTSGRPHILYHVPSVDSLGYYYLQVDNTWNGYGINTPGDGGGEVALAIGSDNRLQASFYKVKSSTMGCLMYQSTGASGEWQAPVEVICLVKPVSGAGITSAIALDSGNYPHIAFSNTSTLGYTCIYLSSGVPTWMPPIYSDAGALTSLSIAEDQSGQSHISYKSNNALRYAIVSGTVWDVSPPYGDESTDTGQYNSIVLDSDGHAHITFLQPATGRLLTREFIKTVGWQPAETIDTMGTEVGRCTSLAFSANGTAYLTYFDAAAKHIKIAVKIPGGSWDLSYPVVDATRTVFCQHSLALKGGSIPAVAYTTELGELRYAEYTCAVGFGCSWGSAHVSDIAWLAESVVLRFNSLNKPRISFNENVQATLAYNDGAGWNLSQIDVNAASGQTALAIGSNDKAYVAYFRNATHGLYYAVQNSASPVTWNTPQLVDADNAGTYVSLVLNGLNWARLAYTALDGGNLRYTYQSMYGWMSIQTVTSAVVESPCLTVDPSGQPRIFYYQGFSDKLYQSARPGASWISAPLDNNVLVGRGLSLATSPVNGKVSLGYFDETVSGLKYLYEFNLVFLPLTVR